MSDYEELSDLRTTCERIADEVKRLNGELAATVARLAKLGNLQAKVDRLSRANALMADELKALRKNP
jgi:predicted  nucleic acid-binding Zn-ribbon protein